MKSKIDSRYDINEEGIWTKEYQSSMTPEVYRVYHHQRLVETTQNDVNHYLGLDSSIRPRCPELFMTHYDICYAFGGGMPKFEAHLNIEKIIVLDGMANLNIYQPHLEQFRKLYNCHSDIEFVQLIFNSDIISCYPYDKSLKTLFTFIHVTEHQTLEEHLNILKKLPKNLDVLIYGPNISRCFGPNWVHIGQWILDHNNFVPYLKMKEILESHNYHIYYSCQYSDDLLFYFNTRN
jgi:hypothetical protein